MIEAVRRSVTFPRSMEDKRAAGFGHPAGTCIKRLDCVARPAFDRYAVNPFEAFVIPDDSNYFFIVVLFCVILAIGDIIVSLTAVEAAEYRKLIRKTGSGH
ncbi:hypothetical protein D3C73_1299120 [compost metagenome]